MTNTGNEPEISGLRRKRVRKEPKAVFDASDFVTVERNRLLSILNAMETHIRLLDDNAPEYLLEHICKAARDIELIVWGRNKNKTFQPEWE